MTQPINPTRLPLSARLAQTAVAASDGLWLVYNGDVVSTVVEEIDWEPIDLVIDLATLSPLAPEIAALVEHGTAVGRWKDIAVAADGVRQRLVLLESTPETVGLEMFDEARQIKAALAQGFPWQASIGVVPRNGLAGYEKVSGPVTVNGRSFTPGDRDLYILRDGIERESSVVLFGADLHTGRVAASARTPTRKNPMADLTPKARLDALTARLGANHRAQLAVMLTDGCTDEEAATQISKDQLAAKDQALADLQAKLAAAEAKCTDLTTQLAALTGTETVAPIIPGGKADSTAPASRLAAMRAGVRLADGTVLRGLAALTHLQTTQPKLPITTSAK